MRIADCHPEKKHYALGACKPCYDHDRAPNKLLKYHSSEGEKKKHLTRSRDINSRAQSRASRYGIDRNIAKNLITKGRCDICETELLGSADSRIDHDHSLAILLRHKNWRPISKNFIRGVLCAACNTLLGCANDDMSTIQSAMDYLETHQAQMTVG